MFSVQPSNALLREPEVKREPWRLALSTFRTDELQDSAVGRQFGEGLHKNLETEKNCLRLAANQKMKIQIPFLSVLVLGAAARVTTALSIHHHHHLRRTAEDKETLLDEQEESQELQELNHDVLFNQDEINENLGTTVAEGDRCRRDSDCNNSWMICHKVHPRNSFGRCEWYDTSCSSSGQYCNEMEDVWCCWPLQCVYGNGGSMGGGTCL